jgi:hypothetical protein
LFQVTNHGALGLYAKMGFVRDERLQRYYLNGGDAYRLKLWIDQRPGEEEGGGVTSHIDGGNSHFTESAAGADSVAEGVASIAVN